MNRRNILVISAVTVLELAMLPTIAVSQKKSLKEQIPGTWTVVSCDSTLANGTKQPFCVNSNGVLMLDAGGRYVWMMAKRDRPKFTISNRFEAPADEFKAAAQGLLAQYGTWSINDADKTLTRHIEGALFPNVEGTNDTTSISLTGDELKLSQIPAGGGRNETVFRRAK